jgi:Uma2 family endonuclease
VNRPLPEHISLADFLIWEEQQEDRFEWIDGAVVLCAGGTYEHATIISNLHARFHEIIGDGECFVQGSDRKLVPQDANANDLGSFFADLFVSCTPEDRKGSAAHLPTIVIEVVSAHVGSEFMQKKEAYLASARLTDYYVVDSTRRYVLRYTWSTASGTRRLLTAEYRRGPVPIPALAASISFDAIYRGTEVPAILHPLDIEDGEKTEVEFD